LQGLEPETVRSLLKKRRVRRAVGPQGKARHLLNREQSRSTAKDGNGARLDQGANGDRMSVRLADGETLKAVTCPGTVRVGGGPAIASFKWVHSSYSSRAKRGGVGSERMVVLGTYDGGQAIAAMEAHR